jgi:hypothetical protein
LVEHEGNSSGDGSIGRETRQEEAEQVEPVADERIPHTRLIQNLQGQQGKKPILVMRQHR